MKLKRLKTLLMLAVMLTCCGIVSKAQPARVVQVLPDDSFIVEVGGKEYRAINADKAREIQKLRIDLEAAERIASESQFQIKEALLQRDLAQTREALEKERAASFEKDFNRAREDSARFQSLFMSERALRQEASSFVPHGNKTKFDKFLALFDNKAVQFTIKGLLPIWTAGRCN